MQIGTVSGLAITVGWFIALAAGLVALFGLIGVVPPSPQVIFGLFIALAVARLI